MHIFILGKTRQLGMAEPSSDDLKWGAGRVELYLCTQCGKHTRFPRYNHPGILISFSNLYFSFSGLLAYQIVNAFVAVVGFMCSQPLLFFCWPQTISIEHY